MDEIEMKQMYNECVTLASHQPGPDLQKLLMNMLQMIWECHERILEMQVEEEDDDE